MVDASESGSVVAPKVDVEVTSINLIAIDCHLHGVHLASPGTLARRQAAHNLGGGGGLRVLKKPVLVHRRPAAQCLKVIEEPDLVSKNGIVEVEVVGSESRTVDVDDSTSSTDGRGSNSVDARSPCFP